MRLAIPLLLILLLFPLPALADEAPPSSEKVIWAISSDFHPIFYKDGTVPLGFSGLWVDLLEEVLVKRLGMDLEIRQLPWRRAQLEVEHGDADVMTTIPTDKRRVYALPSDEPILDLYLHVYTYPGHPKLADIRNIKTVQDIIRLDLLTVSTLGNGWHEQNMAANGVKTYYAKDDEFIAKVLAARHADIMIAPIIPMNYQIKSFGLTADIELTPAKFGPLTFHLLMGKKSRYAARWPEINAALKAVREDGTYARFSEGYFKLD